jgi:hypothetical protein
MRANFGRIGVLKVREKADHQAHMAVMEGLCRELISGKEA